MSRQNTLKNMPFVIFPYHIRHAFVFQAGKMQTNILNTTRNMFGEC
ncbi:hypothetical protein ACNFJN_15200 [Xenorhabdus budapestensis]|uniref:Transposase n=1 Tax=Xenorhabdus budapestensis TaxID=290110 RepID=A0ABX7VKV4_XENBU|nr:hypothetical protein [Xenorhabdus budapestensis]QTL40332.1 hypothetical protein HGO23_02655 [Xenorhabdus budapestensis]